MATIAQINDAFYELTATLLGLDPDAPSSQDRVRINWPPVGAPAWQRTQDVCFLQVTLSPDQYTQQVETTYTAQNQLVQSYTDVVAVTWIFYGPNSFDDSRRVRAGLFKSGTFEVMSVQDMYLVTDVSAPIRSPEKFNGQWWDRSNLFARFNLRVENTEVLPNIEIADIQVIPNK